MSSEIDSEIEKLQIKKPGEEVIIIYSPKSSDKKDEKNSKKFFNKILDWWLGK